MEGLVILDNILLTSQPLKPLRVWIVFIYYLMKTVSSISIAFIPMKGRAAPPTIFLRNVFCGGSGLNLTPRSDIGISKCWYDYCIENQS